MAPPVVLSGYSAIDDSMTVEVILLVLGALVLAYAAWSDIRTLRIPNVVSALLLLLGIAYGFAVENFDWINHAGAFFITFLVAFVLFHFGLLGGGDTKLIPVVVFWIGFAHLLPFLLMMTVAGALLGVGMAVYSAISARNLSGEAEQKSAWRKKAMPYGVAIAVAGIAFFLGKAYMLAGLSS